MSRLHRTVHHTTNRIIVFTTDPMTEPGGESCEELLNLLHQRLIASGEWSSLLGSLRGMLEEDGWDTRLREHAEKEALAQDQLHLPTLVAKLGPYAQKTLPDSVRVALTAKLRDFLERNLEDA